MSGPTYTYTADTPQVSNPMNNTAPIIRENFQAINELVGVNHVGFNQSNVGKHNYVTLLEQSNVPTIQDSELTLYCQATGSPNAAEIFYNYPANSTQEQLTDQDVPITGTGTSYGTASQGYCTFTSGIVIRWGNGPTSGTYTSGTNTFTIGTPAYTKYLYCSATSPTTTGCYTPMGILVNGNISTTYFYAIDYAYNGSVSSVQDMNYLLMGM